MDNRDITIRAHDAPLFMIEVPNNETYKKSVRYAGALQWNNLDKATCKIGTFVEFKARQKKSMAVN